jgi:TM2 domain-containing membrane protein YozV
MNADKSRLIIAYLFLLCGAMGVFGLHRLLYGRPVSGVLMLLGMTVAALTAYMSIVFGLSGKIGQASNWGLWGSGFLALFIVGVQCVDVIHIYAWHQEKTQDSHSGK